MHSNITCCFHCVLKLAFDDILHPVNHAARKRLELLDIPIGIWDERALCRNHFAHVWSNELKKPGHVLSNIGCQGHGRLQIRPDVVGHPVKHAARERLELAKELVGARDKVALEGLDLVQVYIDKLKQADYVTQELTDFAQLLFHTWRVNPAMHCSNAFLEELAELCKGLVKPLRYLNILERLDAR